MNYEIIILPLLAGIIAQFSKFFIKSNNQQFRLRNVMAYSGMPSGHSAIVSSLAIIVGLNEGFDSSLFAISLVVAIITIRDALGIRQYLGQHGKILNILVKDLKEDKMLDETYPQLIEKIGHTPSQVAVGCLIGAAISWVGYIFFR